MAAFRPRLKALWLLLLPTMIGGAVIGTYPGYKLYKYVWEDAQFCTSCHVHDYATVGWENSIHGQATTCHDCHHQPLRAYLKEAYVMVTKRPKFPMDLHHTPYVKNGLCDACHLTNPKDISSLTGPTSLDQIKLIPKVDQSYLHKVHLEKKTTLVLLNERAIPEQERRADPEPEKILPRDFGPERPIVCADCHGGPPNRGHNFSAVDVSCVRCHEPLHGTRVLTQTGCRSCHFQDFLSPVVIQKELPKKHR